MGIEVAEESSPRVRVMHAASHVTGSPPSRRAQHRDGFGVEGGIHGRGCAWRHELRMVASAMSRRTRDPLQTGRVRLPSCARPRARNPSCGRATRMPKVAGMQRAPQHLRVGKGRVGVGERNAPRVSQHRHLGERSPPSFQGAHRADRRARDQAFGAVLSFPPARLIERRVGV